MSEQEQVAQEPNPDPVSPGSPSRRSFIAGASVVGLGAAVSRTATGRSSSAQSRLIDRALAAST